MREKRKALNLISSFHSSHLSPIDENRDEGRLEEMVEEMAIPSPLSLFFPSSLPSPDCRWRRSERTRQRDRKGKDGGLDGRER